jgi:tryptophan synthase alpha chain
MGETGAERLASMFATARTEGRAVLLPFLTAGIPDRDSSVAMFEAMEAADGFEVGIPYADPLMDGPVIAAAGRRSIAGGMTVAVAIDIVGEVAAETGKPVIVMTYTNPVLRYGVDEFVAAIAAAGAAGLIIADLPVEEAEGYLDAARRHGVGMALFVAPTTSRERLAAIAEQQPAFLYGVATLGVTGERTELADTAPALAAAVRSATGVPLVLGVGISTPRQAAAVGAIADGVIVGSALVRTVVEAESPQQAAAALGTAVDDLAAALKQSRVESPETNGRSESSSLPRSGGGTDPNGIKSS